MRWRRGRPKPKDSGPFPASSADSVDGVGRRKRGRMSQDRFVDQVRATAEVCPTGGMRAMGDVGLSVVGQHFEDGPGQAGPVETEVGEDAVGLPLG